MSLNNLLLDNAVKVFRVIEVLVMLSSLVLIVIGVSIAARLEVASTQHNTETTQTLQGIDKILEGRSACVIVATPSAEVK